MNGNPDNNLESVCITALSISILRNVDGKVVSECGAVGGMKISRRNRSSRRKYA
jgi:hypothetical protein